jgi:hypothetical protein
MQITLNKIPFDVRAVDAPLRAALMAEPVVVRGASRPVWSWDKATGKGRYLVPTLPSRALALPTGLSTFVARPGLNGGGPQKAVNPTAKMSERVLAALGAKEWPPVLQALARVLGVPQKTVPFDAFGVLNGLIDYRVAMDTQFQVVELANDARNLSAYLFLPGLVGFRPLLPEGTPPETLPRLQQTVFVIPPPTQGAMALRRLAVARRLTELQADLAGALPADLPPEDPRRSEAARLGAEWKVLQPKARTQAA